MNLPENFVSRTRIILGDEFQDLEKALQEIAPTSVRVNNKMEYIPSDEKVVWCENGYYLKERPLFTADPLFHAGGLNIKRVQVDNQTESQKWPKQGTLICQED